MRRVILTLVFALYAVAAYAQVGTTPVTASKFCFVNCTTGPTDQSGTATTPEATVAACVGSTYRKTNGTTDTTLWRKETGSCTSSGWVAVTAGGGGSTPNFTTLRVGNNTPVLTSPTRGFDFRYLHSGSLSSSVFQGGSFDTTFTPSGAWSGNGIGMYFRTGTTAQAHSANLYGIVSEVSSTSTGTETGNVGFNMNLTRTGGTTTFGIGGEYGITAGSNGTITNAIGLQILSPVETGGTLGVISNYDAIRILDATVSGATDNRAIAIVHPNSGFTHIYANGKTWFQSNWSTDPGGPIFKITPSYTGGVQAFTTDALNVTYDVTATGTQTKDFEAVGGGVSIHGSGVYRSITGGYFYATTSDTPTFSAFDPLSGGGILGLVGDASHYGTSTVGLGASVMAWGGTGSGSTTTKLYRFYVPAMYEYSGLVTTHVGLQIDDQATLPSGASGSIANITNNWLIRAQAPSSKDFAVRADGVLKLGGVLYTFPASDSSGCLQSNGSGTLSWGSCAGSSGYTTVADEGTNRTARATVNFIGAGVSCVDNSGATRTDCTISGGAAATETTGITVDGAGSVITTGIKGFNVVPKAGTIISVTLLSTDAAVTTCSAVFDIWKDTYANYPPTVADTITASAKPTLSSANKSRDATLTGWTTSVSAGDILGYKVDSVTGCLRLALILEIQ